MAKLYLCLDSNECKLFPLLQKNSVCCLALTLLDVKDVIKVEGMQFYFFK